MLLGVDVGGTFTDAVLATDGAIVTAKAPSTPDDQSRGVLDAVSSVLERAGARAAAVERFAHGMTVGTNALLEGRAARTALVATAGFEDVVALGRQNRADLYRLCAAHPAPLAPPELRFGASERTGPDGPLQAPERGALRSLARRVAAARPQAVAVVLLHSYRHPGHELAVREALARELGPEVHISLSHEVCGTFREYERAATTEIDAALSPLLGGYLRRLATRAAEAGLPEPAIMQSNGGLIDAGAAAGHASWTVLSGPAAGAAGAAAAARASGARDALCFDMGGTSCDVCVVEDGGVREASERHVGGRPLALPALDVDTVGAGGGSIAWRDAGGALRVGPRSAGADPGPACYGRGGESPTVTDANLLLGRLPAGGTLAGGVALDGGAARRAVGALARDLGLELHACAEGIVRVANAEMVRALRVATVERGVDPRRFALLAFGGAGPLHATAIADELGIRRILCPRASGVLAALGLLVAPGRRDAQRSVVLSGAELTAEAVRRTVSELAGSARAALGAPSASTRAVFAMRYRGQAFELDVAADGRATGSGAASATGAGADDRVDAPAALRAAFEAEHERRYGYRDGEQQVELVTVRVSALTPGAEIALGAGADDVRAPAGTRRVVIDGEPRELAVWRGALAAGTEIGGPAICELPEATVLVAPGWHGRVDATGAIELTRERS